VITVPTLFERLQADPAELRDLLSFIVRRMIGKDSPELVDMVRDVIDSRLGRNYPWPGNVRELEQCVRRVLLKLDYDGDVITVEHDLESALKDGFEKGTISAQRLTQGYCTLLYRRYGTYEEVSRRTQLDRRTVHKYIREWEQGE
jgi:transcriptional regulator with PAS, ATPase and Fis domain